MKATEDNNGIYAAMAAAVMVLAMLAGCEQSKITANSADLDRGLVIVLPGIDGVSPSCLGMRQALADSVPGSAVEVFDWTSPMGALFNQVAQEHNREMAAVLAERIRKYHREHPAGRVQLVGHSGGTAIAVWAAEGLSAGEGVDRIVLLGSSLSPEYDLTTAMSRTRRGVVNFYSHRDTALLGAGTSLLGTMDGKRSESAGLVGFRSPGPSLVQVAWQETMASTGNDGGHFGCTSRGFVTAYVAPLLASGNATGSVLAMNGK